MRGLLVLILIIFEIGLSDRSTEESDEVGAAGVGGGVFSFGGTLTGGAPDVGGVVVLLS